MKRILYICLLATLVTLSLMGQSVKELEKQRKQTLQQLEQTGKMLKETKRNETATINKLNLLNKDIKTRRQLISNLNSEIGALDREMQTLTAEKTVLQQPVSVFLCQTEIEVRYA